LACSGGFGPQITVVNSALLENEYVAYNNCRLYWGINSIVACVSCWN
jgi:hypothetical protein